MPAQTSLYEALVHVAADDAAAFVGYLVLLAEPDALRDDAITPHLERFAQLAGFAANDTLEARQDRVDAFFAAYFARRRFDPSLEALLANATATIVDEAQTRASAVAEVTASAARTLLGTTSTNIPVGHVRDPQAQRGGLAGLLQARLSAPKKPETR